MSMDDSFTGFGSKNLAGLDLPAKSPLKPSMKLSSLLSRDLPGINEDSASEIFSCMEEEPAQKSTSNANVLSSFLDKRSENKASASSSGASIHVTALDRDQGVDDDMSCMTGMVPQKQYLQLELPGAAV